MEDSTDPEQERLHDEILRGMDGLPDEQCEEAMLHWLGIALDVMPPEQVRTVRADYLAAYGCNEKVLALIEGNLALRVIKGLPDAE